jgi:hypothetical protein
MAKKKKAKPVQAKPTPKPLTAKEKATLQEFDDVSAVEMLKDLKDLMVPSGVRKMTDRQKIVLIKWMLDIPKAVKRYIFPKL